MRILIKSSAAIGLGLLVMLWTPLASANPDFGACAGCHTDIANSGPDHGTHATLANNDCAACHGGGGFNNPPLDNCVQCHGRDQDSGGDNISAGIGRGLRLHHEVTNAATCGGCHSDANGPPGVGEQILPSFYVSALGGAGLDSCDGSEERFPSNSVSLDNDGDGLTDAADADCGPSNTIPIANAGADQTVNVGDLVTLDGSGSTDGDGDALNYSWSLTTPGGGAVLSNPNAVSPTFVPDVDGVYTATLVVTDGVDASAPDAASITAQIVVVNTPPVADAGNDQTVTTGDTVPLNGSGSSDADGDALSFSWSLTAVPAGSAAALSDPLASNPSFVADVEGSYVARLIVNDGQVDSPADSVIITSQTVVINTAPVANAGPDQNASVGDVVVLDGSASTDAEGDPLTFSWSLTSVPAGSGATISNATAVSATFVADLAGDYVAQLVVNDGELNSPADAVLVTAQVVVMNTPPVANAGLDQSVLVGETVLLDGGNSSDADGDPLTYNWSLSVPAGSSAVLSDAGAAAPSFVADVAGDYVAQLIVSDGLDNSAPDSAVIAAAPPLVNQPPVANAGANQTVSIGDSVTLNGGGSSDPDNDSISYRWALTSVPAGSGATLSDTAAVNPTFVADIEGDYVVQLIVNDGTFDSAADTALISAQPPATGGELLYNQNCEFCHGDPIVGPAVDDTLAGLRRVTGSRVCTIEASIFGNNAGERGDVRFPDGVPEMMFLQHLSFDEMQQIAEYLNTGQVSGERRYVSNCAGCHANDGSGGFVGEDVRGDGHETWHAISEEDSMRYLGCLTGTDVDQIAAFLDHPVTNAAPLANPAGPYSATIGTPVTFDGSNSTDTDGNIVFWEWSFGDGGTAVGASATHVYSSAGSFTVTLTVTDDDGLTDTATTTATISEMPLLPVADPGGPYTGFVNESVTLDGGGSADPDGGAIQSWNWDFGDGSVGAGATPTHIYLAAGTYAVQLTVTDDEGQVSPVAMTTVTVDARPVNQAPTADPNGPYTAFAGDTVNFDGSGSSDPEDANAALGFAWDFGDGNVGAGENPTHSYAAAGTYTVTLVVTDTGGLQATATTTASIETRSSTPDGESLYNAWCLGCHGDFDQPNQASAIKVLGARACSIDASINGNHAAGSASPYPDGVPEMQFMQGSLSHPEVDAISSWMNRSDVTGAERYATACASCHGDNGSGGFIAGDIRGEGDEIREAIAEEAAMRFLGCLPAADIAEISTFLGSDDSSDDDDDERHGGGGGASGPVLLLLLGLSLLVTRRRRILRAPVAIQCQ